VDAYSPCPCGSGQKFKWCCHKVETYADRAQRLVDNGQFEGALQILDEGLRKEPGNPWLLMRKSLIQIRLGQTEEAAETVKQVLKANPRHAGALTLLTRLALESEGATEGAAQLQHALSAFPVGSRTALGPLVKVVAAFLAEAGEYVAALKHLELAKTLVPREKDQNIAGTIRSIEGSREIPTWQRHPYNLEPPPNSLTGDALERFNEALTWANEGLWSPAAAGFELLTDNPIAGALADRNLGLCRLWLADGGNAVEPLRRYIATLGTTSEAVDFEALCQQYDTPRGEDLVEQVHLIWPLRNRQGLLDALNADQSVHKEDTGPIDPEDEDSPVVDRFALLDRPTMDKAPAGLTFDKIPKILGRVLVGQEIAALETFDDGRLDDLTFRVRAIAGLTIANAHPKTKVIEKVPRLQLALSWEWLFPEGLSREEAQRFNGEQEVHLVREVWPKTPNRAFRRRTPLQAAQAGDAEVPLRAAVRLLEETTQGARSSKIDFDWLREKLRIPAEPAIDPATVDIGTLNLSRIRLVPVEKLDDEKLIAYYNRARRYMITSAIQKTAETVIARPELMATKKVPSVSVYSDLASLAALEDRLEAAFDWIRKGREADAPSVRMQEAPYWDMLELKLRARSSEPEVWVPELAVILDRYAGDPVGSQTVMLSLLELRLIELAPNPDGSAGYMVDTRRLQALLAEFGPRVTTASGKLGVSASKPEIWTPGGAASAGGGGGLWTPGGGSQPPSGGKPNLIIPGR